MLIAKSKERESVVEDGVIWWKEYRLTKDVLRGGYQVEHRYMARVGDKTYARVDGKVALFTDPETTWTRWGVGATPKDAIEDVIGDSDFFEAESLDSLHASAVEHLRADRKRNKRYHKDVERYRNAVQRLSDWKSEQQQAFNKRHGHKAGKAYEQAFIRTQKRLQPEHDRLVAEVNEAKVSLDNSAANLDASLSKS